MVGGLDRAGHLINHHQQHLEAHMSLFTSDTPPATPTDPIGPAGQRTAGLTAVIMADVLWILGTYVWHGTVPEQVTWTVALVVPYAVSQAAGRLVRRRAVAATQGAPADPVVAPTPVPAVPPAPPATQDPTKP